MSKPYSCPPGQHHWTTHEEMRGGQHIKIVRCRNCGATP